MNTPHRSLFVARGEAARLSFIARINPRWSRAWFTFVVLLFGAANPAQAQIVQISHQAWTDVYNPTAVPPATDDQRHAGYPHLLGFEALSGGNIVRKFFINWSASGDFAPWNNPHAWTTSLNAGGTWGSKQTSPLNLDSTSGIKKLDGTLLAIPFLPKYPPTLPSATFTTYYHISTNDASTWTQQGTYDAGTDTVINGGVVDFSPNSCWGMRFHRGIIEENNGDLYAPVYVRFTVDASWRVALVKSTNGGQLWKYFSTIKLPPSGTAAATETSVVRCKNDTWLAVMRYDSGGNIAQMIQSRSTDHGVTWSASINTPSLTALGVDPFLHLMPNGILVLSYGAQASGAAGRHIRLAFSADGNGTTWSNIVETFTGVDGGVESTGYTATTPISAHQLLQVGDTGTSWSYSSAMQSPNPYAIRQKVVDIVRTQRNRIDLAGKVAAGAATITTDMTYSDSAHPEARTAGAYDGSTNYWSGAFKSATTGSYTIDLQQSQTLTSVGVCLKYNTAQSATVDYSTNGTSWTTLKTYTNAKHNAIDYTDSTIAARYIRVSVTGGTSPISLNEIELYSNADTFENYAYGVFPYGYTSPANGFWVTTSAPHSPAGYQSKRVLIMYDGQTGAQPNCGKTTTATTSKTLEFRYRSVAFAPSGAHQFLIRSGTTTVYQLAVFSDGSIKYYNGSTWVNTTGTGSPAGTGTVPANTWTKIKVVATISPATALVYVNDVLKGTAGKVSGVPTTMNNFLFATTGTLPVGDEAYLDDIAF